MSDHRAVQGVPGITIRPWEPGDCSDVEALLRLLSEDAEVTAGDAPTFVAEKDGQVVGMMTLCVFTTLTGAKMYLDVRPREVVDALERRQPAEGAVSAEAIVGLKRRL